MKITVEKIDDINFIMSGTVENSVIEDKVNALKEQAAKESKNDEIKDDNFEQNAASQVFKEFIDEGIKEANLNIADILGQPALKKYEQQ
ncbi:MAG: trigger factor, partial [Epsilonproteobacteria bacterium]